MVIMDSDMIAQQASPEQTWCLILCLAIVWSSPLYDISVCHLQLSLGGYHTDSYLYIW